MCASRRLKGDSGDNGDSGDTHRHYLRHPQYPILNF
jgi:hypothetical protein